MLLQQIDGDEPFVPAVGQGTWPAAKAPIGSVSVFAITFNVCGNCWCRMSPSNTDCVGKRRGEIAVIQSVDGKWIVGDGGGWSRRWDDGGRKRFVYAGL